MPALTACPCTIASSIHAVICTSTGHLKNHMYWQLLGCRASLTKQSDHAPTLRLPTLTNQHL